MTINNMDKLIADSGPAQVVWLENRPDLVQGWVNVMNRVNPARMAVHVTGSVDEIQALPEHQRPDAWIVDLKLEQRIDGIGVAKRIRQADPVIPLRVVSSYIQEYADELETITNLTGIHDRNGLTDDPFADFRTRVEEDAIAYRLFQHLRISDVTWHQFLEHPYQKQLTKIHWRLFSSYVREYMGRRGWAWAVVCGNRIVSGSSKLSTFPDIEKKEEIALRYGRVPFVYTRPIVSEEGRSGLGHLLDHYPEVRVTVHGVTVHGNLDTGTSQTLVSDRVCTPELASVYEESVHFGKRYEYCVNRRSVIFGGTGPATSVLGPVDMPVAIVTDWSESPWVRVNPRRQALVGRDIFALESTEVRIRSSSDRKGVETQISKL